MKYALINDKKTEATKGAKGLCPSCGSELVAKCGEVKVNHWAHKGNRYCDPWWETETDWHRSWKEKFPIDWQEVDHFDDNSGEKHIADVKTESGWALEFQHSYLKPEERRSRSAFYPKLVWVVDGLRRKRDKQQFQNAIEEGRAVSEDPLIRRVHFPDECRIVNEWLDCSALVFFDFQEVKEPKGSFLWLLLPGIPDSKAFLMRFPRNEFIRFHQDGTFDEIIRKQIQPISDKLAIKVQNERRPAIRTLGFFQRHLAHNRRVGRLL